MIVADFRLKYKPAIYKLFTVKCKWNFWYDGNQSLLPEEPEEQTSNVEAEKKVEDKVFDAVEQYPSFPGGEGAMFSYISNNTISRKGTREWNPRKGCCKVYRGKRRQHK